ELDNYAQQHRLSSSAIFRSGHPSLVVGLLNFRIIKTAALHNCTYLKTVLDLKAAPQGPVGQLSPAQSKIYQDFFAQYPFYKENLALVYSFPIIWRSLESVNYDDLVGAMDLTGNFHDVRYPTLISLTHQHFQRLAHSSAPEDRQALQNYFSTALRELHLDFEENMDFIHLLYAMMPDGVRDIFYASWLQGKHPTLPLHQAYTPRQKRLPRLTFWQENLAITQINKQQADLSTQDELARNTFQAIKQKRLAAGMNWEDFIFTQEANVVYFAYDYLFTTIRTQLINQAAPGWSDELIARHPDLRRATFDPRYLSPAQAHAVRDVLERGIRSVKDKLFYAAYWPLAQIFGPDRLKVARMADPRLANFLLTYKIGR
ncbi:MAG: hypothetical protein J6Y94_06620, partial [Bacteriovoracaceae bacterium]|nr:hypothetical protein [Bacteriovoracaceae bacterium]